MRRDGAGLGPEVNAVQAALLAIGANALYCGDAFFNSTRWVSAKRLNGGLEWGVVGPITEGWEPLKMRACFLVVGFVMFALRAVERQQRRGKGETD